MAFSTTNHVSLPFQRGAVGQDSDLTVKCGPRRWDVSREVLCSKSRFFDGACGGDFLEARTGLVDLSDDDEEAVDHMIHYFYHLDYLLQSRRDSILDGKAASATKGILSAPWAPSNKADPKSLDDPLFAMAAIHSPPMLSPPLTPAMDPLVIQLGEEASPQSLDAAMLTPLASPIEASGDCAHSFGEKDGFFEYANDSRLLVHTRVYALAEKYDIQPLKALACQKFEVAMACYYDSPELADAIEEVYNSTIDSDRGLRNIVIQAFRSHPGLANTADVYEVIKRTPTLAFELWKTERGLPI